MSGFSICIPSVIRFSDDKQDPDFHERCTSARIAANENPELSKRHSLIQKRIFQEHPERKEEIRRRMKEYLSKPGNRVFVELDSHAKPVICAETGQYYLSQKAEESATRFGGIYKVCTGGS